MNYGRKAFFQGTQKTKLQDTLFNTNQYVIGDRIKQDCGCHL